MKETEHQKQLARRLMRQGLDELCLCAAKRDIKEILGTNFSPQQKEVLASVFSFIKEEIQRSIEMRKEMRKILRRERMERNKAHPAKPVQF